MSRKIRYFAVGLAASLPGKPAKSDAFAGDMSEGRDSAKLHSEN